MSTVQKIAPEKKLTSAHVLLAKAKPDNLTDENHFMALTPVQRLDLCRLAFKVPALLEKDFTLVKQTTETLMVKRTELYDLHGEPLQVAIYVDLQRQLLGWDNLDDMLLRRGAFKEFRIVEYETGFIAGTDHPMMLGGTNKGFTSNSNVQGYIMWQSFTYQRPL